MKKKLSKKELDLLNPEYKIISQVEPNSSSAEAYRRIKVALDFSSIDENIKVIQICSSIKGEGKTTTLLNIASVYAESKKRVIIVDLDLRKPKCHRAFRLENKNGLNDVLLGDIELKDAIKHSDTLNFDLLNTGKKASNISYVLESKQLKSLIDELKEMYDIILVDCPPILAVADPVVISTLCDATLFIISQLRTERKVAKDAVRILKENNVNIIGCVFTEVNNKVKYGGASYYNNYYYSNSQESK